MVTLQVAMRFVGNYAPRGLSPQTDGMPVILIKIGCAQPIFIKQFICVDMEAKD
ncbi:hypothetical protein [Peptostreptococcus sp.]|uniref:hypothetical protein n=1 Tax=Peptostreptococcus sp. TaxID=1262 RepID=UPI0039930426